jgi:hypothetical protein
MKVLLRIVAYSLLTVIFCCASIVLFAVSDEPDVQLGWVLTPDKIARAKKILHEGSKTKPDEIGTIELSGDDLNLAANYLLNRYSKSAVGISLKDNKLKFIVTTTLPKNQLGKYLNITLRLGNVEGHQLPTITKFKAGNLLLPSYLAAVAIDWGIRHSSLNNYFILATRPIKAVNISAEKIVITYFSSRESLIQARNFLAYSGENPPPDIYRQTLAEAIAKHDPSWRLSLAELLQPLFALALQRSTPETTIAENRWAIATVNDYINRFDPEQKNHPPYHPVFLYKRTDLAQHFISSAAITASVDVQVSEAVGVEKELHDAQGKSGFSFVDLAADKAGTRFGLMATASPSSGQKLQQTMAKVKDYREFMPDPSDLPEHMNVEDFKKRFGSTQSEEYQTISQAIDARIAATLVYQK